MTKKERKLVNEILVKISNFTKISPPPEQEEKYLAACAKLLKIKSAVTDYENEELENIELLLSYLEKVNRITNSVD